MDKFFDMIWFELHATSIKEMPNDKLADPRTINVGMIGMLIMLCVPLKL